MNDLSSYERSVTSLRYDELRDAVVVVQAEPSCGDRKYPGVPHDQPEKAAFRLVHMIPKGEISVSYLFFNQMQYRFAELPLCPIEVVQRGAAGEMQDTNDRCHPVQPTTRPGTAMADLSWREIMGEKDYIYVVPIARSAISSPRGMIIPSVDVTPVRSTSGIEMSCIWEVWLKNAQAGALYS
ncbi:hypothetical protein C8R44DRAFT_725330 [Mycena epipterygia]|nr:hypothetical protein C8R44DRAFT_725330 [Mycena epipterygia]